MKVKETMAYRFCRTVYRKLFVGFKHWIQNQEANRELKRWRERKTQKNGPKKVAFVAQMPAVWDKMKALYERMCDDDSFETWLIFVPPYDFEKDVLSQNYDVLNLYFRDKYPEANIVYATDENGAVIDLEKYGFEYVFYQRCYELYLPKKLRAEEVIRYAKTCYLPYCFHCGASKEYYETSFFRHLYVFFCSNRDEEKRSKTASLRENVFLGYPVLDGIEVEDENKTPRRVLWTPRWHDDPTYGGSSFMKYKECFFGLKDKLNVDIVMRPHPLTFDNLMKEGKMTGKEVKEYKEKLEQNHIELDQNALVEDTFKETDILITDFSSIIIAYFLTGKPIIYCGNPAIEWFTETYQKMIDSSYVVRSWEELEACVDGLIAGSDPMRTKRLEVISEIKEGGDSVWKILNFLKAD